MGVAWGTAAADDVLPFKGKLGSCPAGGLFSMCVALGHLAAAGFNCREHAEKEEEG